MSGTGRAALRTFLRLGARADRDLIPAGDVERQEDTVVRALKMLSERPGLVLADEVGMGKTYEALGIAAAVRHQNPRSRIVVVTPGPDLNVKWAGDIGRFREMYDFGQDRVRAAANLKDFVAAVRAAPIVLAPVTMFRTGRAQDERAHLLALFFQWKHLHPGTADAIFRRVMGKEQRRPDPNEGRFLDAFTWSDVEAHLDRAFRGGRSGGVLGLDDLFEQGDIAAFENREAVRDALYRARFELCGRLLPVIDLLIVDEAHKLKNPGSLQTRAMRHVFNKRFRKALFLTATPFQLEVDELREIFNLFAQATTAPVDLAQQVKDLLDAIKEYQQIYDRFQQTWLALDPLLAEEFCARYESDGRLAQFDDASLRLVQEQVHALRRCKEEDIEPGLRNWMIRSLRPEKRSYRRSERRAIRATGTGVLPFLLYERLIAELFRVQQPTHKTAVEINMVSSYPAARNGALMRNEEQLAQSVEAYRALLRRILPASATEVRGHPKLREVVAQTLRAAEAGEKTLIFCARVWTLEQLRRELDEAWEALLVKRWRIVYPGDKATDIFDTSDDERRHRGRHSLLQARFHRPQDALYLGLREPCLRTPWLATWALRHLPEVVADANRLLARERVGKTAAARVDYALARKCVAHAAAQLWQQRHVAGKDEAAQIKPILDGTFDRAVRADGEPRDAAPGWTISKELARLAIGGGPSLWDKHAELLGRVAPQARARIVELVARYLTGKQVPFLSDLLVRARADGIGTASVESDAMLAYLPRFWRKADGSRWVAKVGAFLEYLVQQGSDQQETILDDLEKTRSGGFVRHTRDGESRERLRELFNTPLFPMVLVANEVMQEGLDLHKNCRRVIHHDLTWNPAQVEQRIGRVDRLGSLISRMRSTDSAATLDVLFPVIRSTIDERMYRTVKTREKWLEFLLGAQPQFEGFTFSDEIPRALPGRLARELSINLAPVATRELDASRQLRGI